MGRHRFGVVVLSLATAIGFAQEPPALPGPHIDGIELTSPTVGAQITVTGTNFGDNLGILWIANSPAKVTAWTNRQVVGIVPRTAISGAVWVVRQDPPPAATPSAGPVYMWSNGLQTVKLLSPQSEAKGIIVHDVTVYDNFLLQQMLNNDRTRLTGLQFIDQSKVAGNIGTIQGASMQQSGFSMSVGGPPVPGVSSTVNSGSTTASQTLGTSAQNNSASVTYTSTSGSTSTGTPPSSQLEITGPTNQTTATTNNQAESTGPSTSTTYTLSQPSAPTPATSPSTWYSAPSSFAPSASNILNEQMQLNSEAAGLALMMEGPMSDQAYPIRTPDGLSVMVQKHHITLGVPITILPSGDDKDSAAEITLTINPIPDAVLDGAPRITAILPEDKTYNAATISNKSVNFGAGVVTGVLTAGVNWLWQKQTYYIVQAQDTVAFQLPPDPSAPEKLSFGWDLRPVLGNPTVSSGNRTLFVQLAFTPKLTQVASADGITTWGTASVSTRWRKVDKKSGLVSSDSFDDSTATLVFPIRDVNHDAQILNIADPVDNGDGTLSVQVKSNYYSSSTYIRIGTTVIPQGAANATFLPNEIDFTVPATLLATQKAMLSDPTGLSTPLQVPLVTGVVRSHVPCLALSGINASEESTTSAKIAVTVTLQPDSRCIDALKTAANQNPTISDLPLVATIGSKVFGYKDAPIETAGVDDRNETITFHASPDLVRSARSLTVERLLWGDSFKSTSALSLVPLPAIDKATVVKKNKDNLEIALIGSNLKQLTAPAGMGFLKDGKTCSNALSGFPDTDTGRMLCVSASLLPDVTQAALTSASGDLLLVALPTPGKPKVTGPTLEPQGTVDAGVAVNLTIKGTKLDAFDHVEIEKKKVPAELSGDKKSILVHLTADLVKAPKIVLVFFFKGSDNVSYTVNVNKN